MTKQKKKRKRWWWDLEATDWDQPLCAAAVSDQGDEVTFWGGDCLERIADMMEDLGGTWCAHAGGIYDVPMLMNTGRPRFESLILSGSTILAAEGGGPRLKCRDTYPATLASLKKLGSWVGVEKMDVDRAHLESVDNATTLEYCLQDCRVLRAAVQAFQGYLDSQEARNAWTAGAAALNLLRALEPGTWEILARHRVEGAQLVQACGAVRGGRVECWARGRVDLVYSYDFKSSYPARYARDLLGVGCRPAKPGDRWALWRCRWYWPHRRRRPPALDQATNAGAGWCEAWLCPEELDAFESVGVYPERIEGWAATAVIPFGQHFAREMYAQKERGVPWAKVFLNSLHGKLSENPIKDQWTRSYPAKHWSGAGEPERFRDWWHSYDLALEDDGKGPTHAHPVGAGIILGRARAALWQVIRAIEDAGGEVYYCDTDSVHCNLRPDQMPVPLGHEVGDLATEAGPCVGYYLGPKAYLLTDATTGEPVKSALKGVPLHWYKEGIVEEDKLTGARRWRQAEPHEKARDVRRELFEYALAHPLTGAQAQKGGISGFVQGLKARGGQWKKQTLVRTIRPTGRGKTFGKGPTWWAYQTPVEVCPPLPKAISDEELTRSMFG